MFFSLFKSRRVTWCPRKLVFLEDRLLPNGYLKSYFTFPPYSPFSIFIPSIYRHFWALAMAPLGKVCTLPHERKEIKDQGEI
jgi:hypothetical protein